MKLLQLIGVLKKLRNSSVTTSVMAMICKLFIVFWRFVNDSNFSKKIAIMLNVKSDEFGRRKNFYNWELCKSGLRDFLETTRKYGLVQDYFKHREYNERLHAHCMLEHLESHVSFHFSYQSFNHFV